MPRSTSDVTKLEADALAARDSAVRRIDGEAARLRPGVAATRAPGTSSEWAFERSAREFSRLREALNEKDQEIRRLHAGAKQHFEELSRVKAASLIQERERRLAMDRALSSERALSDLQRELSDTLATEGRVLDATRAAWVTATSELAENRAQLESMRSVHGHTLDALDSAQGELASARSDLALLARDLAALQQQLAAAAAELETTEAELDATKNELETSNFHLTATRVELRSVHAEFTTVQSELGETCLAMKALRAELGSARRELQSMRAGAGLDVDGRVVSSAVDDCHQNPDGRHEQRGE
jgi:chromosome segregation ATPase